MVRDFLRRLHAGPASHLFADVAEALFARRLERVPDFGGELPGVRVSRWVRIFLFTLVNSWTEKFVRVFSGPLPGFRGVAAAFLREVG